MARIVIATYMVRYPLGGMLSWALQYCLGFHLIGHHVHLVEKASYPDACFDPSRNTMTNSCHAGMEIVSRLLSRYGLGGRLAFRDLSGTLYGLSEVQLSAVFRNADVLIDIGNHGAWLAEARNAGIPTVLIEGEPGFTQIKMAKAAARGQATSDFDHYYSNGANIGTSRSSAPSAGHSWCHVFNPVVTDLFEVKSPPAGAPFTTVMNWQSHQPISFDGRSYGQKDIEFEKFIDLPARTALPMEVAVAGEVPRAELEVHGWRLRDAHEVTESFDVYRGYIESSLAEFSVCKNVFVATHTGWFSDRSAAYLASGRPVVLQDTGFGRYLPCGEGLFAVRTVEEAAAAMKQITCDYTLHSRQARDIAIEYLDAKKVLGKFLNGLGI